MVKYNNCLKDYGYILSFDLAKQKTGWALVNIKTNQAEKFGVIVSDEKADSIWENLYDKISNVLLGVKAYCIGKREKFFVTKEKLPNQAGKFTTIQSLQSLAQVHSIWELACFKCGVDVYDLDGIHSVSVKAFFKRKYGIEKPTKEDIAKCVCKDYSFELGEYPEDVTDAAACVMTLVEYKWNDDVKSKIKELKKSKEKYKSNKKLEELDAEMQRLRDLEV